MGARTFQPRFLPSPYPCPRWAPLPYVVARKGSTPDPGRERPPRQARADGCYECNGRLRVGDQTPNDDPVGDRGERVGSVTDLVEGLQGQVPYRADLVELRTLVHRSLPATRQIALMSRVTISRGAWPVNSAAPRLGRTG